MRQSGRAMIFRNRREAGKMLASELSKYKGVEGVIVLALPRGGVVNGFEIARELNCPLDIIIVRKIGFPGQPELAIGAVAETGAVILNDYIISSGNVSQSYIDDEIKVKKEEIKRRKERYRGGRDIPHPKGKTVIVVDDGVATGATFKAAIAALKEEKPARIVAALPVSSIEAEREISRMVDEWVCLQTPPGFMAIGSYYEDFTQVTDEEVIDLLERGWNA